MPPKRHVFFRYHKPLGVLSTTLPTGHGKNIMDVLSPAQRGGLMQETEGRFVVPVGRLDKDSTGLLLLTTDESVTGTLLRPGTDGSPLTKVYLVETRKRVQTRVIEQLKQGVELSMRDWGDKKKVTTMPCVIERVQERLLRFELREGKNRQIRKMLGSAGHDATRLHRVAFGPVAIEDMAPNELRRMSEEEVKTLMEAARKD
jgi:23S rRNA pseudouridine2604 synthase